MLKLNIWKLKNCLKKILCKLLNNTTNLEFESEHNTGMYQYCLYNEPCYNNAFEVNTEKLVSDAIT